ncbi:hypothetical protein AK812_SmicGene17053 [Symbiodinium microadriaticum]|uniref:Uncharacterized protein n=1 Tax=Symbiodinium microadriaticum TaxID=2951 RepID=A0A1Q9DYP9_SYMMI|nr:hypothetical protein AK812_SmicGene17053 [Symbiodinium microadriaticum]
MADPAATAAMENVKKEAARRKLEALAAIEEEANAELLRYERQLQTAKEAQPAASTAASSKDVPAASSEGSRRYAADCLLIDTAKSIKLRVSPALLRNLGWFFPWSMVGLKFWSWFSTLVRL